MLKLAGEAKVTQLRLLAEINWLTLSLNPMDDAKSSPKCE